MDRTPAQVLADDAVLSMRTLAYVLGLVRERGHAKGEADPRRARELVRTGAIRLVDPSQSVGHWSVASIEVQRYLQDGPRRGAEIVPLRSVS